MDRFAVWGSTAHADRPRTSCLGSFRCSRLQSFACHPHVFAQAHVEEESVFDDVLPEEVVEAPAEGAFGRDLNRTPSLPQKLLLGGGGSFFSFFFFQGTPHLTGPFLPAGLASVGTGLDWQFGDFTPSLKENSSRLESLS